MVKVSNHFTSESSSSSESGRGHSTAQRTTGGSRSRRKWSQSVIVSNIALLLSIVALMWSESKKRSFNLHPWVLERKIKTQVFMPVCVCVCVLMRVHARACVHVCVRACVCVTIPA